MSIKFTLIAVNKLLSSIGQAPVNDDIEIDSTYDAKRAKECLEETKREVLARGWDFNTDKEWDFPIDQNGYIPVPYNVLDIVSSDRDIIMRDWRLYSRKEKSAIFKNSVKCKVIWDMDFNSITYPIRHYITIKASRIFQREVLGDNTAFAYSEQDERNALFKALSSNDRTAGYNMLNSEFGREVDVR
jgi:hypothetical protein